ncbi:endonuclease [Mycoplasmopsis gallinacea]|uniref:Uncharacterized protein n=1 Tax=Mycoplasmopsis gallinacea TaxID=29556 RepID=A0A6H0V600_9BACT|nr:endonuclease [Mycoplasmopsis gallinacea]QIW62403.1 hypothetical protein GOQ20_03170 [Mycoplasmopsis gallinacea]
MAPTSMVFTPFILTSCNEPKTEKETTPKNTTGETTKPETATSTNPASSNNGSSNETPAPTNPSTGGTTNPENPTPENPTNHENGSGTSASADTSTPTTPENGSGSATTNNLIDSTSQFDFNSSLDKEMLKNKILENQNATGTKKPNNFVYDRKAQKVLIAPQKINWKESSSWPVIATVKSSFIGSKQLVNAEEPTYTDSSGKTKLSSFLNVTIENNVAKFTFKTAIYSNSGNHTIDTETHYFTVDLNSSSASSSSNSNTPNTTEATNPPSSSLNQPNTSNTTIHSSNSNINYLYDSSNNYYASLEGKRGLELFQALTKLQKSKSTKFGYGNLEGFYNGSNSPFRDKYYEKDGSLLDIYSENPDGIDPYVYPDYKFDQRAKKEGDGTNREHIVPQSWFNKVEPIRSDPFFVWPTDITVNHDRENLPHDDVLQETQIFRNGAKKGNNSFGSEVFEPVNAFKGDIARAYFYFIQTYNQDSIFYSDANKIFITSFPFMNNHYLNVYSKWNSEDPVDQFDIDRNNATAAVTNGRRNPFTDYPNLVENLFGENPKPFHNLGVLVGIKENSN